MTLKEFQTAIQKTFKSISLNIGTILGAIARDFITGTLPLRATSLVYTTILSIVPLLALSFSVLKGFGVHNQLEPILLEQLAPLGEQSSDIAKSIIDKVNNVQVGVLGAIGLGFLLYTVVSLIQKIEAAFNGIWQIDKPRAYIQRFTGYLSVITVGPILLFSIAGLKAKFTTNPFIAETLHIATNTASFMPTIIDTVSAVIMPVILFTLLNKAVPNTKVNWIPALLAGISTTVLWKAAAGGFSTFIASNASYDAIYSSFAVILLIFIWLYLNWLIILIGGSLCFYIQNPEQSKFAIKRTHVHPQDKLYQALLILKTVHTKFEKGENPLTLHNAGKILGSHVFAKDIIESLSSGNIIHFDDSGKHEILLQKAIDKVSLYDVIDSLGKNAERLSKHKTQDSKISKSIKDIETEWSKTHVSKII